MMNKATLGISSTLITLKSAVSSNMLFSVPLYQRLYVWKEEQIKALLSDLKEAYLLHPKEWYYLGGVLLSENGGRYDLIDGQQRFTTLWLIARFVKGDLQAFSQTGTEKLRIRFLVREFANRYFEGTYPADTDERKHPELLPIVESNQMIAGTIRGFAETETNFDPAEFATFIFEKVQMIATTMPPHTDENKLFEAMNNRGIQLEQHEILKSRLLEKITSQTERHQYGLLWDACSMMSNYLEKNIKDVAGLTWNDLFPKVVSDRSSDLPTLNKVFSLLSLAGKKTSMSLLDILEAGELETHHGNSSNESIEYEQGQVRGIVSFPMFLLHVLRIFQFRIHGIEDSEESAEIKGKKLISIFENYSSLLDSEGNVKDFIKLLWQVRQGFDKYLIKWCRNDSGQDEEHLIKRLYRGEKSIQRREPEQNEGFALLQSMLYHSQELITQYWLTPFLNKCSETNSSRGNLYEYLQKLDNEMFMNPRRDLRMMSYSMLSMNDSDLKGDPDHVAASLRVPLGTSFPSYWFYKLEFVLWQDRKKIKKEKEWDAFRITSKNSVEHISPQNPKSDDRKTNRVWNENDPIEEKTRKQDDFGNLVLISPGLNSEYSNKAFLEKRGKFIEKQVPDSLKSALIFENEGWNWDLCAAHRNDMIQLLVDHVNLT
jgi:hypothetical protein